MTDLFIDAPLETVAGFAADPANAPQWYANITSVEWMSPPPAEVGSHVEFVARFMGRTLRYTYVVIEFVPNERLVMRTAQGPFPMETSYTWQPHGEGTSMTLRNRGSPSGFARLFAPFVSAAMRRENRKDLRRLATIVEPRPTAQRLVLRRWSRRGPG